MKEKASACCVRNDGGVLETRLREDVGGKASACCVRNDGWAGWGLESFGEEGFGVEVLLFQVGIENHGEIADKDAAEPSGADFAGVEDD